MPCLCFLYIVVVVSDEFMMRLFEFEILYWINYLITPRKEVERVRVHTRARSIIFWRHKIKYLNCINFERNGMKNYKYI